LRAGTLYVPPDPNAASGYNELGNGKICFKILARNFLSGCSPHRIVITPSTALHSVGRNIATPMLIHLGEEDGFISHEAQAVIKASVAGNPDVEVFSYPGCSHAFARQTGTRYDADAAKLANGRTWAFFGEQLR